MNIKNLNFLEKHVEKIAIGIALVFFGLVMWRFVLGTPYTIEVVTRTGPRTVTPDQVETMIRDQARTLETRVKNKELPFERIPLPSWTEDFRNRMTGRFLPVDRLAMPMNHPGLDKEIVDSGNDIEKPQRVVPTPPAPLALEAHADYAVLAEPSSPEQADELVKLVGNLQPPRDFRYVSIGASFDLEAWKQRLKGENLSTDQRIPEDWWRYRMLMTDVQLERQTYDPATGQWGQTTRIAPVPNQVVAYRDVTTRFPAAEVPALLTGIRDAQDQLARPSFVPLERGVWTPPGSAAQLSPEQAQELVEIQQRISVLERRLGNTAGQGANPAQPAPVTPPGTRNDPNNPFGVRPQPSEPDANMPQSELAQLQARRNELLGIARNPLQDDPTAQPQDAGRGNDGPRRGNRGGFDRRSGGFDMQPPRPGQPGQADQNLIPELPEIKLWAHDLTVEPGKTYRYRLIVSMLSPLFHVNDVPREQYDAYFNRLSLQGEPSEWSEPVRIDPEIYFFFTSQDAARQQATVDVFRIFNGVWVRRSFDVRSGDPIGGVVQVSLPQPNQPAQSVELDMSTQAMVVDILFPQSNMGSASNADQTRMLLYHLTNQRMDSRILGQETSNQTYQRLLQEMQIRSAMASGN